ncbi:hypothetical protein K8R42_03780, partial [bacterium]|nr:hypothetical protein [bacterium]
MLKDNKDKKIQDSDADGLLDQEEKELGTNPYEKDTDHDDLDDYEEVNVYKTDPTDPDTDCDDIGDGTEVKMGRNPRGKGSLRDLFIPNHCNNYRPHALHPKRLAFHAVSAIAIKVVMIVFALSFPVQAWLSPDILYEQGQKIVQLTNNIRAGLNIHLLQESEVLEQAALNKAEDMLVNEYFAHLSPDNKALRYWLYNIGYSFKVAGENLAMGFSGAEDTVEAWKKSPTHYSNIIDPDFTEIGVGAVSGIYNGTETTLIAQYFGDPKIVEPLPEIVEEVAPEPEPEPEELLEQDKNAKVEEVKAATTESEPEPEPIIEEVVENDEVLAEKEEEIEGISGPLAIPTLISPADDFISKDNLNILTISAPQAEKINVYVDGLVLTSKNISTDVIDLALKLDSGKHNISITAFRANEKVDSKEYTLIIDQTFPVIDHEKTNILVSKPVGQDDIVVKVEAFLSNDTKEANVVFADYNIELHRDLAEEGKWAGHQIVSGVDYNDLLNPIVLATLTATDQAGNSLVQDIEWQDITPATNTTVNQYIFLKNNQSEYIKPLFNFGS